MLPVWLCEGVSERSRAGGAAATDCRMCALCRCRQNSQFTIIGLLSSENDQ